MNLRRSLPFAIFAGMVILLVSACSLPTRPLTPLPTATLPPATLTPTFTPSPTPSPAIQVTPLTPPVDGTPAFHGTVQLQGGSCCIGGTAGQTIQVQADFYAASPFGKVVEMRTLSGGGCRLEGELASADWQPYTETLQLPVVVAINWVGFYVSAQFRDEQGNLSPVVCDDISVEGMPPVPSVDAGWFPQIRCFAENEVHPAPGETVRGPGVTFSWPGTNTLPEGIFYRVFAYSAADIYSAQVAGGTTRETSLTSQVSPDRAGEMVWYVVLVDASGVLIDHNRCSSFPASLLTVDPPEGIKGIHFQYQP